MLNEVAVLIPVYNDNDEIIKTLNSIDEKYNDFTVFIVDDGSRDPIAIKNCNYSFNIVTHRLSVNSGITKALNAGLEFIRKKNKYKYIARLDAGDRQEKNRLYYQWLHLVENDTTYMVGSNVSFFNSEGEHIVETFLPLSYHDIKKKMYVMSTFIHPAVMFRIDVLSLVGDYSLNYPAAEDYEYFIRISKKLKTENMPSILIRCLDRVNGISNTKRKIQLKSVLRVLIKNREINVYWFFGVLKVNCQLFLPKIIFTKIKKIINGKI